MALKEVTDMARPESKYQHWSFENTPILLAQLFCLMCIICVLSGQVRWLLRDGSRFFLPVAFSICLAFAFRHYKQGRRVWPVNLVVSLFFVLPYVLWHLF